MDETFSEAGFGRQLWQGVLVKAGELADGSRDWQLLSRELGEPIGGHCGKTTEGGASSQCPRTEGLW